ncbi:glycogen debranching enzyme family protein [Candidatus Dojkabacteria bacterium]|nr:glycogen debranching enzyme family protein [Candidatus Dojkabacteria bacterium]
MKNEYLLTNNTGSYSSSDYLQGNTRKYHGLLVVSDDDVKRKVIVSTLEERLVFNGTEEEYLSTTTFNPNLVSPNGSVHLINKIIDDKITLDYLVGEIKVLKQIQMIPKNDQILVSYKISSPFLTNFKITPFLTNRSFHDLSKYNNNEEFSVKSESNTEVIWKLSQSEYLKINSTKFRFFPKNLVYKNFYYQVEKDRGYDYLEDLIYSGTLVFDIYPNHETTVNLLFTYLKDFKQSYISYSNYKSYIPLFEKNDPSEEDSLSKFKHYIEKGAKDFVIQTHKKVSIIAGYHWFEDWGRDTFISFRGLLLVTKQYDKAKKLLLDWSSSIKFGLIPNRPGLEEYNSLDATLWYIISIYNYYIATKDGETVFKLLPIIKSILSEFKKGTLYGIQINNEGFLISRDTSKALTWMDAVYDNIPFTSRVQAAVEIQLLWYNVLNVYKTLVVHSKNEFYNQDISENYIDSLIEKLEINFETNFWNSETNTLNDFINENEINCQIRPNPVIGLHLPFKLLSEEKAKLVLATIEDKLLTPIGLKTLNNEDSNYCPEYTGDQCQRDRSYHNGTVWPWVYGAFLISYLTTYNYSEEAKDYVKNKIQKMWEFIETNKLNYLPEIFSAESLKPDGCLSQAWNYATFMEVLDALEHKE